MTQQNNLLDKFYKGESSHEEEKELKSLIRDSDEHRAEQDIFEYFSASASIPEGLEDDLFAVVQEKTVKRSVIRRRIYSAISAAAVVLVVLTFFLDFRNNKRTQMEDDFFVMEQALFQISESLQAPQEPDEMLVLWVDNDVEIIIN